MYGFSFVEIFKDGCSFLEVIIDNVRFFFVCFYWLIVIRWKYRYDLYG